MKTITKPLQLLALSLLMGLGSMSLTAQDVYMAGNANNVAALWENGTAQPLANGHRARSVFISNGDVYVAGYGYAGGFLPKLWINGTEQTLALPTDHNEAVAQSVFVSGSDVYVAGHATHSTGGDENAVLWTNGVPVATGGALIEAAYSVFASGSDVYVAGIQYNGTNNIAKLWINGVEQTLALPTDHDDAIANSVFVSGSDVYVAGYAKHSTGGDFNAVLWTNGVPVATGGTSDERVRSVFVSGGNVYMAGFTNNGTDNMATLWVNGTAQALALPTDHDEAVANSVYASGADVYVAGYAAHSTGGDDNAVLWTNGTPVAVGGTDNEQALSVFVDDGQLGTETIATPQNSFSLYPNPVQNELHINSPQPATLQLYNLQGQLLREIEIEQNTTINISDLASGVYFIKDSNSRVSQKVIKQ